MLVFFILRKAKHALHSWQRQLYIKNFYLTNAFTLIHSNSYANLYDVRFKLLFLWVLFNFFLDWKVLAIQVKVRHFDAGF